MVVRPVVAPCGTLGTLDELLDHQVRRDLPMTRPLRPGACAVGEAMPVVELQAHGTTKRAAVMRWKSMQAAAAGIRAQAVGVPRAQVDMERARERPLPVALGWKRRRKETFAAALPCAVPGARRSRERTFRIFVRLD